MPCTFTIHYFSEQNTRLFYTLFFRLSGHTEANVVFIPSSGPSSEHSQKSILDSTSALNFFQKQDVQRAIHALNAEGMVFVVEEVDAGTDRSYIITTIEGKRVYPLEKGDNGGLDTTRINHQSEDIWNSFLGNFGSKPSSSLLPSSGSSHNDQELFIQSPSRFSTSVSQFSTGESREPRLLRRLPSERSFRLSEERTSSSFERHRSNPRSSRRGKKPFVPSPRTITFSQIDQFNPEEFNPFIPEFKSSIHQIGDEFSSPDFSRGRSLDLGSSDDVLLSSQTSPDDIESILEPRGETVEVPWNWPVFGEISIDSVEAFG